MYLFSIQTNFLYFMKIDSNFLCFKSQCSSLLPKTGRIPWSNTRLFHFLKIFIGALLLLRRINYPNPRLNNTNVYWLSITERARKTRKYTQSDTTYKYRRSSLALFIRHVIFAKFALVYAKIFYSSAYIYFFAVIYHSVSFLAHSQSAGFSYLPQCFSESFPRIQIRLKLREPFPPWMYDITRHLLRKLTC